MEKLSEQMFTFLAVKTNLVPRIQAHGSNHCNMVSRKLLRARSGKGLFIPLAISLSLVIFNF